MLSSKQKILHIKKITHRDGEIVSISMSVFSNMENYYGTTNEGSQKLSIFY